MVKNILENVVYIEPNYDLLPVKGMCKQSCDECPIPEELCEKICEDKDCP